MNRQLAGIRSRLSAAMSKSEEVAASHERYDPFIDRNLLARKVPLDNEPKKFGNPMIGPESEGWKICRLQSLPTEVYHACLQYLDIATLTGMRRVSQFTRHTIDSLHQYQELYEHTPQALRACLGMGVAAYIPLLRLYGSLRSVDCYYCPSQDRSPNFGSYLSVYECRRACLFCLRNKPKLKPVEFMTLASLCSQRNTALRSIDNFCLLRTMPDEYGPSRIPTKKSTLLLAASIATIPGKSLSEKEQRALFGDDRTADIYHHALVHPRRESNINADADYVAPDALKKATQTYLSVVQFPYLTNSKIVSEYGVLCEDCNLHMHFEEQRWMREQETRRQLRQNPSASLRTRNHINSVREQACVQYTTSEEALHDLKDLTQKMVDGSGNWAQMSIQEHKITHQLEKLTQGERDFREKARKSSKVSQAESSG